MKILISVGVGIAGFVSGMLFSYALVLLGGYGS